MNDLSVIIINYRSKALTKNCLRSVFDDLANQKKYQIKVCVTDNSNDGTVDMVKKEFPQVECELLPQNRGFANAVNFSLKKWPARYYLLLNPDMIFLSGNVFERLIDWMDQHPDVGLAGPKLINPDNSVQDSCLQFPKWYMPILRRTFLGNKKKYQDEIEKFLLHDYDHTKSREVDWVLGTGMLIRNAAYEKVGGMDERFLMYFEDVDYCRRYWQAGFKVYYIADIPIIHYHGRDSASDNGLLSIFKNRMTRIHIKSWLKYIWKWRKK